MPRNRYIKFVREVERAQIAQQEEELIFIEMKLRFHAGSAAATLFVDGVKERRRVRLEHKRLHKPDRPDAPGVAGLERTGSDLVLAPAEAWSESEPDRNKSQFNGWEVSLG